MTNTAHFDASKTREDLCRRGWHPEQVVRYAYRPFDIRWLYWDAETDLLDRSRPDYMEHVLQGNLFLSAGARNRKEAFYQPQIAKDIADHHLVESNVGMFPLFLREKVDRGRDALRPNLSNSISAFLAVRNLQVKAIFQHVTAILHAPLFYSENAGALRMDWPRVPLPAQAESLDSSAALGATLINVLHPELAAPGVSSGKLRPVMRVLGLPHKRNGKPLEDTDLVLCAGWGHVQTSRTGSALVMPGLGLVKERAYTAGERTALIQEGEALGLSGDAVFGLLGERTLDVHLNEQAMWTNIPIKVWEYKLGGYQVLKKWLSYRERKILGRALRAEEVAYVSEIIRRIAAILLLGPILDANYKAAKASAVEWSEGRPVAH